MDYFFFFFIAIIMFCGFIVFYFNRIYINGPKGLNGINAGLLTSNQIYYMNFLITTDTTISNCNSQLYIFQPTKQITFTIANETWNIGQSLTLVPLNKIAVNLIFPPGSVFINDNDPVQVLNTGLVYTKLKEKTYSKFFIKLL